MKSRPVLIIYSVLAALDVLGAGAAFGGLIGVKALGMFVLGTKAVQVGMNFYVQGKVTPTEDVAAFVDRTGKVVAGRASGTSRGASVAVVPTDPKASAQQIRAAQLVAQRVAAVRSRSK